ncbi:hypothetical protein O4H29_06875 [Marinobacter salarius]|uniref:hypothetical protein n=1 Tax=Marinobacter salarius TaxID=1420917 RepID=UPI0022B0DC34|nr:hypothetical protein [Marinobacter salarius]MCZ4284556.1 hypothetical protein [Marinobacter salarius]
MPAPIVLRNLVPETKKVDNPPAGQPKIATRSDLRDGTRTGGGGGSDGDPVGGGSGSLEWSALNGLADQNEITLTTDTHAFVAPSKATWLGFGEGWLYSQTDDTPIAQSIAQNGETISYEFGVGSEQRFVKTVGGLKVLESVLHTPAGSNYNAGFINWDNGEEITAGNRIFMFSRVMCTDGSVSNASFQWKQERIRAYINLNGESHNSAYIAETTPNGSGGRIVEYEGNDGAASSLYTSVPTHGEGWFNHAWMWRPNTPDANNGLMAKVTLKDGDTGLTVDTSMSNSGGDVGSDTIRSSEVERPRYASIQDYIGNNSNNTSNVVIRRTDQYWQLNGTHFFLSDSDTPSGATQFWPLRIISVPNSQTAVLKLWKGTFADYSGKAILVYDEDMNFVDGVQL